jgi:protein gp37
VPAAVRFISAEPLLGSLEGVDLGGIDWVISGGESGAGHRPIDEAWVRELRDRCRANGIAFFHKQWGGRWPKQGGRELDGRTYDEWPDPKSDRWRPPASSNGHATVKSPSEVVGLRSSGDQR